MSGAVAQERAGYPDKTMEHEQINQKMADLRSEADAMFQAASNLRKDAGRQYANADKLWGYKKGIEAMAAVLLKFGHPIEPHIVEQIAAEAIEQSDEVLG